MSDVPIVRASHGTPPPPAGIHDLRANHENPFAVAIDANVFLQKRSLLPLLGSAQQGGIRVVWSPSVMREVCEVVYRSGIDGAVQNTKSTNGLDLRRRLRSEFSIRAEHLESQIRDAERTLRYISVNVSDEIPVDTVRDPNDWHLVHLSKRAKARILLSLDQRHLPHGLVVDGVQCWHPDTFLTLFFQQNPEVYQSAVQFVRKYPSALRTGLLSR